MKSALLILACIISLACQGQDWHLGQPLDIKDPGRNKILYMKNGNTLLFHFEKDKTLLVKVFDSTHKEIASRKDKHKMLNFNMPFDVKVLWDINDEAVLFVDQEMNSKHCLLRFRYDPHTGRLVDESLVGESQSLNKKLEFYPIKHKDDENYAILFCMDKSHRRMSDIFVVFFDNKHQSVKEVQLPVDRKKYDDLDIVSAQWQPKGVLITASLIKTQVYALGGSKDPINERSSTDDHFLQLYYIPVDSKELKCAIVPLSTGVFPNSGFYTYNPFAQSLNFLLLSSREVGYQNYEGTVRRTLFFKIDEQDISSVGVNGINHVMANAYLQRQTDTNRLYSGSPFAMFTNDNGLTTIFSQTRSKSLQRERIEGYSYDAYVTNICITQVDDNGNELWGILLPFAQYYSSYRSFPAYARYLINVLPARKGKNFYMVFNDYDKNLSSSIASHHDTVYNLGATNACYYKMDRKKEISKHYLFGEPMAAEYKTCFMSGCCYDERTGTFASLVQYRKGKNISFCMGWSKFD
ncbi:MAG: hypothetical protein K0Q79_2187 [Flavipsychrobacter sp.]|jgi:hypothetical protein|nr:hypothetical protein [Flavipsychrobacter sp.]